MDKSTVELLEDYLNSINFWKDSVCEIACGKCCFGCNHLENTGCNLEREDRPRECLAFMCNRE